MANPYTDRECFVHLHVHSEYSFLRGASRLKSLVQRAAELAQPALAITDLDSLSGAPELLNLCRRFHIKPIFGAETTLDSGPIVALAKNRKGFSTLCRLLTAAHLEHERNHPHLEESRFLESAEDLIVLTGGIDSPLAKLLLNRRWEEARRWLLRFREHFGENLCLEIQRTLLPGQEQINRRLLEFSRDLSIPVVATNHVHYHDPALAHAQDALTCIRNLIPLDEPHEDRCINGELWLKSSEEMRELFSELPEACDRTLQIAEQCEELEIAHPRFVPRFHNGTHRGAARRLRELTDIGARSRYGSLPPDLTRRIEYELKIITDLGFADYFLVVYDLVQFAKERRIRHAGRGSAADSVVAYCLDITKVDAFTRNLRFERFINPERAQNLPDIDIDFDARFRDDVTEYVTKTYGRDHVATVCTFARFRARSAVRDIARVLGFTVEDIDRIAKNTHWATTGRGLRAAIENRPELRALNIPTERFDLLLNLCADIDNLPRHLSTHLGGVVITGDPIWEISPLQMAAKGIQVIQYDKDGVEDLRLFKLDLLCLRMLGAVEDSVAVIENRDPTFQYDRIDCADPATFEMIRTGDTAGAFQIESPAQMSLHPRLKTRAYEDVVASVALIRPGPIKGEMVEPFIRRRNLREPITSIHPAVDKILRHTYGVVLYQEQVVSIAIELAGFDPGQADNLRRAISHHRSTERMEEIGKDFVTQAIRNGVPENLARTVFGWLEGYAGYGFCEAHAAAFGDTSFRTAYLLNHHPAEFFTGILNNQPMGFYPPATIVNEARIRDVHVRGPDVQRSAKEFKSDSRTILVGLKQIKGISAAEIEDVIAKRPYSSWGDFLQRTRLPRDVIENLILCGAFENLHPNRRALLYSLGNSSPPGDELELDLFVEPPLKPCKDFSPYEKVAYEWEILGFSPLHHPLEFWRDELQKRGVKPNREIKAISSTEPLLKAAGWVIRPHTPPTRSGKTVVFFSLDDETGLLNVTTFPNVYEKYGHLIFSHPLLIVEGRKDHRGANSLIAERILPCSTRPKRHKKKSSPF